MKMVPADVPALLGLDMLDVHQLTIDTMLNFLAKRTIIFNDEEVALLVDDQGLLLS